jgi:hypothetical protein
MLYPFRAFRNDPYMGAQDGRNNGILFEGKASNCVAVPIDSVEQIFKKNDIFEITSNSATRDVRPQKIE